MDTPSAVGIATAVISTAGAVVAVALAIAVARRQGQLRRTGLRIGILTSIGPRSLEGKVRPDVMFVGIPNRHATTYVYMLPLVLYVPDNAAPLRNVWLQVASRRRQAPREFPMGGGPIEVQGLNGAGRVWTAEGKYFTELTVPVIRPGEKQLVPVAFEYTKAEVFRPPVWGQKHRRAAPSSPEVTAETLIEVRDDGFHVSRDIGNACPDPVYIQLLAENMRPRTVAFLLVAQQAEDADQLEKRAFEAFPGVLADDLERWYRRHISFISDTFVMTAHPYSLLPERLMPRYRKFVLLCQAEFSTIRGTAAYDFSLEGHPSTMRPLELPWLFAPRGRKRP